MKWSNRFALALLCAVVLASANVWAGGADSPAGDPPHGRGAGRATPVASNHTVISLDNEHSGRCARSALSSGLADGDGTVMGMDLAEADRKWVCAGFCA